MKCCLNFKIPPALEEVPTLSHHLLRTDRDVPFTCIALHFNAVLSIYNRTDAIKPFRTLHYFQKEKNPNHFR